MNEIRFVLDASALIALLNQEPGAEKVNAALKNSCMSAVNLAEVVSKLAEKGVTESDIQEILDALSLCVVPFDADQARISGLLRVQTKPFGLSLGDRSCLSLARHNRLTVLTADQVWSRLRLNLDIQVIR